MFSVVLVTFLLLSDINTDFEFKGTLIFYATLVGSFFFIYVLSFTTIFSKKLGGDKQARLFFMQDVSVIKFFIYVPIGLVGAFTMALLSQNLGLDAQNASLFSIAGSGLVMMIIFFVTKTILIPILIHGAFNTLVIAIRDGVIQSFAGTQNELFPIPDVGITSSTFNQFTVDLMTQFTLVSPAEEMMKMLIIAFVVLGIPNARFKDGISKYIGAFFALLVWTMFHTIQAVTG